MPKSVSSSPNSFGSPNELPSSRQVGQSATICVYRSPMRYGSLLVAIWARVSFTPRALSFWFLIWNLSSKSGWFGASTPDWVMTPAPSRNNKIVTGDMFLWTNFDICTYITDLAKDFARASFSFRVIRGSSTSMLRSDRGSDMPSGISKTNSKVGASAAWNVWHPPPAFEEAKC